MNSRRPALLLPLLICFAGSARADDYVSVRGAYYREDSTRVIQPMVEVERDSPSGLDVNAHYLVDTITSASVAAGVLLDKPFTEVRNEAGLSLRKRWATTQASVGYRYSAESDYWSHGIGLSLSQAVWQDTGLATLSLGRSFDSVLFRGRTPACLELGHHTCPLDSWYGGVSYTQVLSPVLVAQAGYEVAYLEGFLANPYRAVPNAGYEVLPYAYNAANPNDNSDERRLRNAIAARVAYYFPDFGTGIQLHYRFYWDAFVGPLVPRYSYDPWNIHAHTFELRVFQQLTRDLEVRVLYRHYIQTAAAFWCDLTSATASGPNCRATGGYDPMARYYTSDPKLGPVHTEYPELKLYWDAESWRGVPFFGWFAAGTFEVSYGHYFQSTTFGGAHVLQAGYRMPY